MHVRPCLGALLAGAALSLLTTAATAGAIIDDFEVGAFQIVRSGPNPGSGEQIGLDPAHVLGGGREILVGEFGSPPQTLEFDAPAGVLRFNSPASPGYFEVSYGKPGHFINANLAAGASAFLLELPGAASIPPNRITVHTSAGDFGVSATQTGAAVTPLAGGGLRSVIPFALLGPNANLTNVQYLTLEFFRVSQGNELVISHFATIPEPRGLALATAAGIAWLLRRPPALAPRPLAERCPPGATSNNRC